jgi:hypothetical protein
MQKEDLLLLKAIFIFLLGLGSLGSSIVSGGNFKVKGL